MATNETFVLAPRDVDPVKELAATLAMANKVQTAVAGTVPFTPVQVSSKTNWTAYPAPRRVRTRFTIRPRRALECSSAVFMVYMHTGGGNQLVGGAATRDAARRLARVAMVCPPPAPGCGYVATNVGAFVPIQAATVDELIRCTIRTITKETPTPANQKERRRAP